MTEVERLEAAAAKLDAVPDGMTYSWFDERWITVASWGPPHCHVLAALLRAIARHAASGNDIPAGRGLGLEEALRLADVVLS